MLNHTHIPHPLTSWRRTLVVEAMNSRKQGPDTWGSVQLQEISSCLVPLAYSCSETLDQGTCVGWEGLWEGQDDYG